MKKLYDLFSQANQCLTIVGKFNSSHRISNPISFDVFQPELCRAYNEKYCFGKYEAYTLKTPCESEAETEKSFFKITSDSLLLNLAGQENPMFSEFAKKGKEILDNLVYDLKNLIFYSHSNFVKNLFFFIERYIACWPSEPYTLDHFTEESLVTVIKFFISDSNLETLEELTIACEKQNSLEMVSAFTFCKAALQQKEDEVFRKIVEVEEMRWFRDIPNPHTPSKSGHFRYHYLRFLESSRSVYRFIQDFPIHSFIVMYLCEQQSNFDENLDEIFTEISHNSLSISAEKLTEILLSILVEKNSEMEKEASDLESLSQYKTQVPLFALSGILPQYGSFTRLQDDFIENYNLKNEMKLCSVILLNYILSVPTVEENDLANIFGIVVRMVEQESLSNVTLDDCYDIPSTSDGKKILEYHYHTCETLYLLSNYLKEIDTLESFLAQIQGSKLKINFANTNLTEYLKNINGHNSLFVYLTQQSCYASEYGESMKLINVNWRNLQSDLNTQFPLFICNKKFIASKSLYILSVENLQNSLLVCSHFISSFDGDHIDLLSEDFIDVIVQATFIIFFNMLLLLRYHSVKLDKSVIDTILSSNQTFKKLYKNIKIKEHKLQIFFHKFLDAMPNLIEFEDLESFFTVDKLVQQ